MGLPLIRPSKPRVVVSSTLSGPNGGGDMASLDELRQMRWNAINPEIIYAPENAITQVCQHHPELGWPQSGEGGLHDVLAMAGRLPVAMGGAAFYHWVGVRGRDGDQLQLANPAPGWMDIYQTMTRAEFDELGPFAAVWAEHLQDQPKASQTRLRFDPT